MTFHDSQHAALINEALVARVLHAAFRARSECRLSRVIFHSHRTNAPGSRSQSKRSGMELELRTLRDRARRAIDPPTARAIVGYRASSSILVIDDSDLSELIDPLENSISICLLVHSIFVLRIRIHLLHGVAEKTDCTTRLFYTSVCPGSSGSSKIKN